MNRLKKFYQDKVLKDLKKDLGFANDFSVPRLTKIIVNMGIGDVAKDKQAREKIMKYMAKITGQKPQICKAKKSVAEFSIREGEPIGVKTTLRGDRAYAFLDKLISIVLPRVRDFQGVKRSSFDRNGNYNFGLVEQVIFPEINYDDLDKTRGLQITINTTASQPKEAFMLLQKLGMPFEKEKSNKNL